MTGFNSIVVGKLKPLESRTNMNSPKFNNDMELNLYCKLLPLAYEIQKQQTDGLISGSRAEEIRDKMYKAIIKILIFYRR